MKGLCTSFLGSFPNLSKRISSIKKKSQSFWQQNNRILVFLERNHRLRLYLVCSMNGIDILIEKLDGFIRKYYKNRLLKGLIYSSALLCSFFLFAVLLEYFGEFDVIGRSLLFYGYFGLALFILVF